MRASPKPNTTYKNPDPGIYIVWLISLIDMGTQTSTGKFGTKSQRKIRLIWELCDTETSEEDKRPLTIGQEYTWDFGEKANLFKLVKPWIAKTPDRSFDLTELFNHPAQVSVEHNQVGEKTYANIGSIMPLPKGSKPPKRVNDFTVFDMDDSRTNVMQFLALPEWIRTKILKSPEGQAKFAADSNGTPDINQTASTDIPF